MLVLFETIPIDFFFLIQQELVDLHRNTPYSSHMDLAVPMNVVKHKRTFIRVFSMAKELRSWRLEKVAGTGVLPGTEGVNALILCEI